MFEQNLNFRLLYLNSNFIMRESGRNDKEVGRKWSTMLVCLYCNISACLDVRRCGEEPVYDQPAVRELGVPEAQSAQGSGSALTHLVSRQYLIGGLCKEVAVATMGSRYITYRSIYCLSACKFNMSHLATIYIFSFYFFCSFIYLHGRLPGPDDGEQLLHHAQLTVHLCCLAYNFQLVD